MAELANFIQHEVWTAVPVRPGTNLIDSTWVRKWKRRQQNVNGKTRYDYCVKSRLCCRGFLDKQKYEVLKCSSTATRLSQKVLMSNAANNGFDAESWDISSAFLRGLTFAQNDQIAAVMRVPSPLTERTVYVLLPGNAWYILHKLGVYLCQTARRSEAQATMYEVAQNHVRTGRRSSSSSWRSDNT